MKKMTSIQMKNKLEQRLANEKWNISFNRDKDTLRVEWKDSKQGLTISIPNMIRKFNADGEAALGELEDHIKEALRIMNEKPELNGKEKHIFPVIRST